MFDLKTRVLIVDDMMTMRKVVGKSCKEIGFTDLTEAKDGADAWSQISSANPPFGLIISDWNMPNSSGMDLLKRVRGDQKFKGIPFILVTAESEKTQIIAAVQAGVTNYVVKPFSTEILKEKLEAAHKKISGG